MIEVLLGLTVILLANLYWIYKAARRYNELKAYLHPLNATLLDADSNLSWALLLFIILAVFFIILVMQVPG